MTLHRSRHTWPLWMLSVGLGCAGGSDPAATRPDAEAVIPSDDAATGRDASTDGGAGSDDPAGPTGVSDWSAEWLFPATPSAFRVSGDTLYWVQAGELGRISHIMKRPIEGSAEATQVAAPMRLAPAIAVMEAAAFVTTTSGQVYAWDFVGEPTLRAGASAQTASELLMEGSGLILVSAFGYHRLEAGNVGATVESAIGDHPVEGPDGLYWIDQEQGQLMRYAAGASTPVGVAVRGRLGAVASHDEELLLIVDDQLLAFDDDTGLSPIAEITGDGPLWADDDYVFWIDVRTSGEVFRVARLTGLIESVFAPMPGSLVRFFGKWKNGVIVTGMNDDGESGFWWLHPKAGP